VSLQPSSFKRPERKKVVAIPMRAMMAIRSPGIFSNKAVALPIKLSMMSVSYFRG
jgi:hypothetical protein